MSKNLFVYLNDETEDNVDLEISHNLQSNNKNKIIYTKSNDKISYVDNKSNIIDNSHSYYKTQLITPEPAVEILDKDIVLSDKFPETAFIDLNTNSLVPELIDKNILPSDKTYDYNLPNHWGQRKLLLSEINFLTSIYEDEPMIVIYAGAAPGIHIPILSNLFTKIEFHLYDPKPFDKEILDVKNIKINPYYVINKKSNKKSYGTFSNDVATWYSKNYFQKLYFISDIRTIPKYKKNHNSELLEAEIMKNQMDQLNWIYTLNSEKSLLKFKMPYPCCGKNQYYKYLKGDITLQVWTPTTSSETRLIVSKEDLNTTNWYDIIAYERKLAYYNYLRQHVFNDYKIEFLNGVTLKEFWEKLVYKIDSFTIDFYIELLILKKYYDKFITHKQLFEFLQDIVTDITLNLNKNQLINEKDMQDPQVIQTIQDQDTQNIDSLDYTIYSKSFKLRKSFNDNE